MTALPVQVLGCGSNSGHAANTDGRDMTLSAEELDEMRMETEEEK